MENNKKTYINYARGIAIILVVFGHMIEMTLINESVKFNIDFAFYLLHVPTFLLISGYLFKYTKERHDLKHIIITKTKGLLCVYILWGIVLSIFTYFVNNLSMIDSVKYSLNAIWYLLFLWLCIIGIIVIELFPKKVRYILWAMILLLAIIAPFYSGGIAKIIIHFLIFSLGYYGFEYIINNRIKYMVVIFFAVSVVLSYYTGKVSMKNAESLDVYSLLLFMLKIIGSMIIPIIVYEFEKMKKIQWLNKLGGMTLYIYVLHFFLIGLYKNIHNSSVVVYILSACIVIFITYLVAVFVKKNKKLNILFTFDIKR